MNDRPTLTELLQATRHHLETQVIPLTKGVHHKLYFQTLVAVNVLKIAEREVALGDSHARAEWSRLDMILGIEPMPHDPATLMTRLAERNAVLCQRIRNGQHDEDTALFAHLLATTTEQLTIANPKYLAQLHAEDNA